MFLCGKGGEQDFSGIGGGFHDTDAGHRVPGEGVLHHHAVVGLAVVLPDGKGGQGQGAKGAVAAVAVPVRVLLELPAAEGIADVPAVNQGDIQGAAALVLHKIAADGVPGAEGCW